MNTTRHTLQGGSGYWQTDRYPIGGEFHRVSASIPVSLTGKRVDFGTYAGFVEFKVEPGVVGPKPITGYTRPELIIAQATGAEVQGE